MHTLLEERGGSQSEKSAFTIVRGCQECHYAWSLAIDPDMRSTWGSAVRTCLEELFQILEQDLQRLVQSWLLERLVLHAPALEDPIPVFREVLHVLVLNTFTFVVEKLPGLVIDEKADVYNNLLSLAKQSLYNRS